MNLFYVFIFIIVLAFAMLIILDVSSLLSAVFSHSLQQLTQNSTYVTQYQNATGNMKTIFNAVLVIGFILVVVVFILYERNR